MRKSAKKPLAAIAYESIVEKIISLEYKPSQMLEESTLMADLAIGRTPIREALVRLQGEKMVEAHPNRGIIVRPVTLQNVKAMFESMHVFEHGVAEITMNKCCISALEKMTSDNKELEKAVKELNLFEMVEANHRFHLDFAKASQNGFLLRAVKEVRNEAKRLSYLSYTAITDVDQTLEVHYATVLKEHNEIIYFLENKNLSSLKELISRHINTFRERIIRFMVS